MITLIEAVLVIYSKEKNNYSVLVEKENNKLPSGILENTTNSLEIVSQLAENILGISVKNDNNGWLPLFQQGIFDNQNRILNGCRIISIPYYSIIDSSISLDISNKYTLIPIQKLIDTQFYFDHDKIINYITNNI